MIIIILVLLLLLLFLNYPEVIEFLVSIRIIILTTTRSTYIILSLL